MPTTEDYEKELKERREKDAREANHALAHLRDVAAALGSKWVEQPTRRENPLGHFNAEADLMIKWNDALIYLRANGWQNAGRVVISGGYPKPEKGSASYYGLPQPRITASLDKTAQQIAADITRRFWPEYERGLIEARQRNAQTLEQLSRSERALSKVLCRPLNEREAQTFESTLDGLYLGTGSDGSTVRAEARADIDGEITLKLHNLAPEMAARIVAMLRRAAAKEA